MNKATLNHFLAEHFPQSKDFATLHDATDEQVTFVLQPNATHLRPGNTISGPIMMALADLVAYVCLLNQCQQEAQLAVMAQAVTTNLNINFMHRPQAEIPLWAHGKLLKIGQRLAVCEISIEQSQDKDINDTNLVAHCTCTYALPPQTVQS